MHRAEVMQRLRRQAPPLVASHPCRWVGTGAKRQAWRRARAPTLGEVLDYEAVEGVAIHDAVEERGLLGALADNLRHVLTL